MSLGFKRLKPVELWSNKHKPPSTKPRLGRSTRKVTTTIQTALFDGDRQPAFRQMTDLHSYPNPNFIIIASIQQVVTTG